MKKYFLKIGSLATFSTTLIIAISCSPKSETEEQSNMNLESLLAKFTGGESTQTKTQITTILKNKNTKNALLDVNILKSIGFIYPSFSNAGITTTYSLVQSWTTSSTKLRIKVTLKRTGEDSKSKIIIITPKVINFATEKAKFVNQKSDKTKAQINSALSGKSIDVLLTPETLKEIGFKAPSNLDTTSFTYHYTLEEAWTNSSTEARLKVILKKSGEKSSGKIFAVFPKGEVQVINIFKDELKKWESFKTQNSQKTIAEVNSILSMKNKNALLDIATLRNIGFKVPNNLNNLFSHTYTLEEVWTNTQPEVQIKVSLQKNGKKSLGLIVTMNTKEINFQLELNKFIPSYKSSKTKKEITDLLPSTRPNSNLNLATIRNIGYPIPSTLSSSFTAKYSLLQLPTDSMPKFKIEVILEEKRGDKSHPKEIIITPNKIDFKDQLAKFSSVYTSDTKTKTEIINKLTEKSLGVNSNLVDLTDVGYSQPTFDSSFNATYKLTKVLSSTSQTVTIEVTLEKKGDKSDPKEIIIKPLVIAFSDELSKFIDSYTPKTKSEVNSILHGKRKDTQLSSRDLQSIGYTNPSNLDNSFTPKYILAAVWNNNAPENIKIQVILEKKSEKSLSKIIIIKLIPEILKEALSKMPSSINSSKKRAENNLLNDSLIKQTITQMGFEKNKIPKFEDGIYIVYRFRIGKNPATNVDWLWDLNPYYLSFQLVKDIVKNGKKEQIKSAIKPLKVHWKE